MTNTDYLVLLFAATAHLEKNIVIYEKIVLTNCIVCAIMKVQRV